MAESYSDQKKTLGKGEVAHYEQFLLFPQCFQKACLPGLSKCVIVWEWVNRSFEVIVALQPILIKIRPHKVCRLILELYTVHFTKIFKTSNFELPIIQVSSLGSNCLLRILNSCKLITKLFQITLSIIANNIICFITLQMCNRFA